jgi:ribbon-helix-helix protein
MGTKTKRAFETVYLDHEKLDLLKKLAKDTRIPRAVLAREAIDDLLVKYKVLKAPKRRPLTKRRPAVLRVPARAP